MAKAAPTSTQKVSHCSVWAFCTCCPRVFTVFVHDENLTPERLELLDRRGFKLIRTTDNGRRLTRIYHRPEVA